MKGVITLCMKELVQQQYGADKWAEILRESGHNKDLNILPISDLEDEAFFSLLEAAAKVLGVTRTQIAEMNGEYWVTVYSQKIYKPYYESATSARELLSQMDKIHVSVTKNVRGANPPRFTCQWENDKSMVMTYQSSRGMIDYMVGTVKGVGKLFNETLNVTKMSQDRIKVIFP